MPSSPSEAPSPQGPAEVRRKGAGTQDPWRSGMSQFPQRSGQRAWGSWGLQGAARGQQCRGLQPRGAGPCGTPTLRDDCPQSWPPRPRWREGPSGTSWSCWTPGGRGTGGRWQQAAGPCWETWRREESSIKADHLPTSEAGAWVSPPGSQGSVWLAPVGCLAEPLPAPPPAPRSTPAGAELVQSVARPPLPGCG